MINIPATDWSWPWWYTMISINIVQVTICIYFYRQSMQVPDAQSSYVKWMRIMGLVFTIVACYRTIFVSRYLYQYAWFDTVLNSSLLIRLFAWCAELSFAGLIAFAIEETLWSVGFLSILPLVYIQCRRVFAPEDKTSEARLSMLKSFAIVNISWCVIYCAYVLIYHLPTEYWVSAFEQIETGLPEIKSGFSAVFQAFSVVNVTHDYNN